MQNRKVAAFLLTAATALMLTGCAPKTPEAVLDRASIKSMVDQTASCENDTEMRVGLKAGKQEFSTEMKIKSEILTKPSYKAHMVMDTSITRMAPMKMEAYVMEDGDHYLLYMDAGTGKWEKQFVGKDEISSKLDQIGMSATQTNYMNYRNGMSNLTMNEETVNGVAAYHVVGDCSVAELQEDADSMLSSMGMDDSKIDWASIKPLKVEFWVNKKNYEPIKFSCDMTEMMQQLVDQAGGASSPVKIEVTEAFISNVWSNFGGVADFDVSKEASEALFKN